MKEVPVIYSANARKLPGTKQTHILVDDDIFDKINREQIELGETLNGGVKILKRRGSFIINSKNKKGKRNENGGSVSQLVTGQAYTRRHKTCDKNDYTRKAFGLQYSTSNTLTININGNSVTVTGTPTELAAIIGSIRFF